MKKINTYSVVKTDKTYRVNMIVKGADLFIDIDIESLKVVDSSVERGSKKEEAMSRAAIDAIKTYFAN